MYSVTEEKIQAITKKIVEQFQPEKIILFGSYAWGNPGPDSDVDLLIIKSTERSTRVVAREIDGALFPRPFPIDLIVYRPEQVQKRKETGDLFIQDVLVNGKVLYVSER